MIVATYKATVFWPMILTQTLPVAISKNKVRAWQPPTSSLSINTLILQKDAAQGRVVASADLEMLLTAQHLAAAGHLHLEAGFCAPIW
jgi:hypothetical protein